MTVSKLPLRTGSTASAKCIPTLRRSVETAEHFDLMQDSGLLDAMIELTAIRTVLGLLF